MFSTNRSHSNVSAYFILSICLKNKNVPNNVNNDVEKNALKTAIGFTITYIIVNDATGVGIIDDIALIFLIPIFFML